MLNELSSEYLKDKFGNLISRLYTDYGISLENINNEMVSGNLLDGFERNIPESFLQKSIEVIAKECFNALQISYGVVNTAVYWAGTQYVTISLNCRIPIKQVFLLCPLPEMVAHFKVYHEMNDSQMIEEFLSVEYQKSILKILRNNRNLTVNELSILSEVPESTIKYYEKSNKNLFSASFLYAVSLSDVLRCSIDLFRKTSSFVPFFFDAFKNADFYKEFEKTLRRITDFHNGELKADLSSICFIENGKKHFIDKQFILKAFSEAAKKYTSDNKILFY